MKTEIKLSIITITAAVLFSCSKSSNPVIDPPVVITPPPAAGNGYVVKTIGVSRISLGVDANSKLTVAELFGGGNRVILKPGTGNKVEMLSGNMGSIPDVFYYPDGFLPYLNTVIDNGSQSLDTTGTTATVFKLRGFDQTKTGYNQINLVMQAHVWPKYTGWAGFEVNVAYLQFTKATGKSNADYGIAFLKSLFSGNINVASVEMAKPRAEKPYITRDQVFSIGQAVTGINEARALSLRLTNLSHAVIFSTLTAENSIYAPPVGGPLKFELVNADQGVVNKLSTYIYEAKFNNIKTGGLDQVVEPADSVSKVFIRITGFNQAFCGYNQLRLFLTKDGFYDGTLRLTYNDRPPSDPSLQVIKDIYLSGAKLTCMSLEPSFPHY